MPSKRTKPVLSATETLSLLPIEDRIESVGYFSLSAIALMFDRTIDEIQYDSVKGWLGKPREAGKRKLYSLAQAEYLYERIISPEQIRKAVNRARNDNIARLVTTALKLRDLSWREANKDTNDLKTPKEAS